MSNGDTDTGGNGNWFDSLSDDLKGNELIKNSESLENFVKSHVDLHKTHGDLNAEHETLKGKVPVIPDTPDAYELDIPKGLLDQDNELVGKFRSYAHEIGLTNDQAKGVVKFNMDLNKATLEAAREAQKEATKNAEEALKSDWGDQFQTKYDLAERAVTALGGDDLVNLLESRGLTRDPIVIRMFYNIALKIGEDSLVSGEQRGSGLPVMSDGRKRLKFPSMDKK